MVDGGSLAGNEPASVSSSAASRILRSSSGVCRCSGLIRDLWCLSLNRGSAPDPGSVARGAPTPRSAPSQARRARHRTGGAMVASLLVIWSLAGIPQCTELCLGDEQLRLAEAAPQGSTQRTRGFEEAAQHYRKAANPNASTDAKAHEPDKMAPLSDAKHPNQLEHREPLLRE